MTCDIFTLCEFASTCGSKLTIVNADNIWELEKVPGRMKSLFLVVRIHFTPEEHGLHTIQISFLNSQKQPIVPSIKDGFQLQPTENAPAFMVTKTFNLNGLPIISHGDYEITLELDDTPLKYCVLSVVPAP